MFKKTYASIRGMDVLGACLFFFLHQSFWILPFSSFRTSRCSSGREYDDMRRSGRSEILQGIVRRPLQACRHHRLRPLWTDENLRVYLGEFLRHDKDQMSSL